MAYRKEEWKEDGVKKKSEGRRRTEEMSERKMTCSREE